MRSSWKAAWDRLRRNVFVRNSLTYSGSNVLGQGASFVSGLVLRRIFPPAVMGYWNLRGVAQNVLGTFDLGADIGAARELPLLAGRGRSGELGRCRSTAFWFALLQSLAITLAWSLYVLSRRGSRSPLETKVLLLSGGLFLLTDLQGVYTVFFRSAQAYGPLSRVLLLSTLAEALLLPAAAYWGGLRWVFAAAVAAAAARMAYFVAASTAAGIGVGFCFSRPVLRSLLKFGAVARIVDYPNSLAAVLPALWVTKLMTLEELALFSLASGLAAQVGDVSTRVGTVFITRFLERAGGAASRRSQAEEMRRFLTLQLLVAVPLLCWAGGFSLPLAIRLFIPKYSPSVEACLILLVSTFFLTINSGLTVHWFAEGRLLPRGMTNAASLGLMAGSLGWTWFFLGNRTISGVAWGAVMGNAGYFCTMLFAVGREMWPATESLALLCCVAVAAAWTYGVLHWMGAGFATWQGACARGALGLAGILPVAAFGLWRSGLMEGTST